MISLITHKTRPVHLFTGSAFLLAVGLVTQAPAFAANCSAMPVSGKTYNIVNEASGLLLDVAGKSVRNGANVIQWPGKGQTNQQWTLTENGNGAWSIRPVHSGKSLDVYNWSKSENGVIKQWTYYGNANQLWKLSKTGSGAFQVTSTHSGLLLTIGGSAKGATAYQASDKATATQHWYFNPVDGNCSETSISKSFMGSSVVMIGARMENETAQAAPFDIRYEYLHSKPAPFEACYQNCWDGCDSDGWWGCYGTWNHSESGVFVPWWNDHDAQATWQGASRPQIRLWTWYSLRDLGEAAGYSDGPGEVAAINNGPLLKRYMDDFRFFLEKNGSDRSMVQLEPDFWGYVQSINSNPHLVPAQVTAANPTDCASRENSAAGLAGCLISMVRKYAPNAAVGIHSTCWNHAQAGGPQACAQFMRDLGAGQGDFLITDASDRDAGWYELQGQSWHWWDDQGFVDYLAYIKTVTEAVGKPMVIWQIPLGNMAQNNTYQHYKDNKLDYFFSHMDQVAGAHVAALLFGPGQQEQTTPESDGGNLINKTINYRNSGGTLLR